MSTVEEPSASIRELGARIAECLSAGDHEGAAAIYVDDAVLLPPGAPAVGGRAAIAAFWASATKAFEHVAVAPGDIVPLGDGSAVEQGVLSLTLREGPTPQATGKYLVVWVATHSGWRISRDIWNMDA